jgi:pimeloyl-ACP methyl ester carboxylesterase
MKNIVLVHGGWHGGWVWRDVAGRLRSKGHRVFTPTLTGVGERSHLAHPNITPDIHVQDIENVIAFNELKEVLLVGHSYGGFVITGVASKIPENISALVYLDAFVPTVSGQSAFSIGTKKRADEVRATITDGFLVPPSGMERWTDDPKKREWLSSLVTPHPIRCFSEGPTLSGRENEVAERSFILCGRHKPSPFWHFYDQYKDDPLWRCVVLYCLHDAMIELPDELTELIHSLTLQSKS